MATQDDRPTLLIRPLASAEETRAFCLACAECGWRALCPDQPQQDGIAPVGPSVLLVGEGQASGPHDFSFATRAAYDLLIAHDETVLDRPDLLTRCRQLLLGPYDQALLREQLEALQDGDAADGIDQAMLAVKIIGRSRPLKRLLRNVAAVARYDAPVAIRGETGTGKELVARAVHYSSARSDEPFVPVNCGALSDDLLVAELFGYEKGAFTDARRAHAGLVAQAGGGTLFLDEVDSLSAKAQAALLRFLQEREYRTLGGEGVVRADVRVISATNQYLPTLVAEGRFREDLFYRLQVVDLAIPPLRERGDDIAVLAEHFLHEFSQRYQEPAKRLHAVTLRWMRAHSWPGNVRELENYLHRVFIMSDGPSICVPHPKGDPVSLGAIGTPAREPVHDLPPFQEEKARAIDHFERDYLRRVMAVARGNVSLAARHAGKERRAFCRLLKKHGIDRQQFCGLLDLATN